MIGTRPLDGLDDVAAVDNELRELRERLLQEVKHGRDGEAAWVRLLIDDALDRRAAFTRDA